MVSENNDYVLVYNEVYPEGSVLKTVVIPAVSDREATRASDSYLRERANRERILFAKGHTDTAVGIRFVRLGRVKGDYIEDLVLS